jgi:hypothetical protein
MKRVIIILLSIIFIALGVGGTMLTLNAEKERVDYANFKETINNDYEAFRISVEEFSNERTKVYETLQKIEYLEDIPKLYEETINAYKAYESKLDKVFETGDKLKEKLLEKKFKNKDLANKKEAYITNYEQTYNYFVSDVEKLNQQLDLYNAMVDADTTNSFKKLDLFSSKYKELIDVNEDGIYSGIDPE